MLDTRIESLEVGSEYPLLASIEGNGSTGRWRRIGTLNRTATTLRVSLDRQTAWVRPALEVALSGAELSSRQCPRLVLGVFAGRSGVARVAQVSLTSTITRAMEDLRPARRAPRAQALGLAAGAVAPRLAQVGWILA